MRALGVSGCDNIYAFLLLPRLPTNPLYEWLEKQEVLGISSSSRVGGPARMQKSINHL